MAVATAYTDKTDEQKAITEMVRQFVDNEVIPVAEEHDHEDTFPEAVVEQMKELGLFGVTIPEEHGGMGLDLTTYAMIVEELSRGWISISGVVNTHFIGSYLLMKFGTDEQKEYFLPKMATREIRAAFSLSQPEVRSDLEAGMAKLFASETGKECVEECFRIHGGYGYSKEYEIERLYRDAPLLLIGEGTSEIQRMVIGKKLLQRHKL